MFNDKDEYAAATENASINQYGKGDRQGYKLGIFNLLLLTTIVVMGYVSFDSLKEESNLLEGITILNPSKPVKMETSSDHELIQILSTVDIAEEKEGLESLSLAINDVVNDSALKSSSYEKALSLELDKKSLRTVVVQKGDTLASISEKYYGDVSAYNKIIAHNRTLTQASHTIFPGQELILPY